MLEAQAVASRLQLLVAPLVVQQLPHSKVFPLLNPPRGCSSSKNELLSLVAHRDSVDNNISANLEVLEFESKQLELEYALSRALFSSIRMYNEIANIMSAEIKNSLVTPVALRRFSLSDAHHISRCGVEAATAVAHCWCLLGLFSLDGDVFSMSASECVIDRGALVWVLEEIQSTCDSWQAEMSLVLQGEVSAKGGISKSCAASLKECLKKLEITLQKLMGNVRSQASGKAVAHVACFHRQLTLGY